MSQTNIAVLLGGNSAEREVSLASGEAVYQAIVDLGLPVIKFDPQQRSLSELEREQVSHVMIMLHGRGGEDGTVQGALEWMGIPYTGTGVLGSAIAMDKLHTKHVWQALGLPTAKYLEIDQPLSEVQAQDVMATIGSTLMVKPSHEGSSIGMAKTTTSTELVEAIAEALTFDERVLVEQFIQGAEYTVSILAGQALPSISMVTPNTFYDYDAKYNADTTQYHCPSDLTEEQELVIGELSLQAFNAVSCKGWGRVDLMRDEQTGEFVLLEVNTVPGMTQKSLVPKAALQAGYSFAELVRCILVDAFGDSILQYSDATNIGAVMPSPSIESLKDQGDD
jgi:D-alanine-D-alanine ligase